MSDTQRFSVIQMRQGEKFVCLGEDQYLYVAKQEGDEMPQAVEFDDEDEDVVKEIKQMILEMTSYNATDRPTAHAVVKKTAQMYERGWLEVGTNISSTLREVFTSHGIICA